MFAFLRARLLLATLVAIILALVINGIARYQTAAEQLKDQADHLTETISRFMLSQNNAAPALDAPNALNAH